MKINNLLKIIIIIIFSLFLIFNLSLIFTYDVLNYELPSFFNINVFIEKTNSMNPTIEIDDLVISKKTDVNDLKEDNIVIFFDSDKEIYSCKRYIEKGENDNFILKGDSEIDKISIKKENVKGKYVTSFKFLGKFLKFMGNIKNWILVNLCIIILFVFIKILLNKNI